MSSRVRIPRWALLAVVGVAYCVLRIVYALGDPWTQDQIVPGNLAHAILHGRAMPWWIYQFPDYAHGTILATPLFLLGFVLFGEINAVNMAVGVLFGLGTCVTWVWIADRFAPRRLAWGVGVAFVLSVPYWNFLVVKPWGLHAEPCFFAAVQFALLLAFLEKEMTWRRTAVLGVVSGLATLFYLHNLAALAAIAVYWSLRAGWREAWGRIAAWLGTVSALVVPTVVYNAAYGQRFGYFAERLPGPGEIGVAEWLYQRFAVKTVALFADVLPRFAWFGERWQSAVFAALVLAGLVVTVTPLIRGARGGSEGSVASTLRRYPVRSIVLVYAAAFFAEYVLGSMEVRLPESPHYYRYLAPLYPVSFVLLAMLFERFGRAGAVLLAAVLLIVGQGEVLGMVRGPATWNADATKGFLLARGYDPWRMYAGSMPLHLRVFPEAERYAEAERVVCAAADRDRPWALQAMGVASGSALAGDSANPPECAQDAGMDRFVEGAGIGVARGLMDGDVTESEIGKEIGLLVESFSTETRDRLCRGLGWGVVDALYRWGPHSWYDEIKAASQDRDSPLGRHADAAGRLKRLRAIAGALPADCREAFVFGLGVGLGDVLERGDERFGVANIAFDGTGYEPSRDSIARGVGYGLGRRLHRFHGTMPKALLESEMARESVHTAALRTGIKRFGAEWGVPWAKGLDPARH